MFLFYFRTFNIFFKNVYEVFLLVNTINLRKKAWTVLCQKLNANQSMVVFHNLKNKTIAMRSAIFDFLPNSNS